MSRLRPCSGQQAGPVQAAAPAPVLTAVKLMYAGAAVSAVTLIISLALVPAIMAALRKATPRLTAAQVSDVTMLIVLALAFGLAVVALWVWLARANSQGRNWARVLSTALFGATFIGGQIFEFTEFTRKGLNLDTSVFGSSFYVLTGLHGAHVTVGIVWLLSLWGLSMQGQLKTEHAERVEIAGLYWHFVDVVWIVIFTVVYLLPK